MRWRKHDLWKAGIIVVALLLLLIFMIWLPMSAADAHTETSEFATPTVDLTVTALAKEQLTLQVRQLQESSDRGFDAWVWNNAAAIVASFLSTLVVVIGALIGFRQWRTNRQDAQDKELKDRKEVEERDFRDREAEREKETAAQHKDLRAQAEERFKNAVTALGSDNEATQVGGAILLRSFLNPEDKDIYGRYYAQIFDLAVAYLRPTNTPRSPTDPDIPLPLTSLRIALIAVFKEVFPLARDKLKEQDPKSQFKPQSLDASHVNLDNAYLANADLEEVWMPEASLQSANLSASNFTGAKLYKAILHDADFSIAQFTKADLREADLRGARVSSTNLGGANLTQANLSGVKFTLTNFKDTDLMITNLRGANFQTDLFGVSLSDVNAAWRSIEDAYLLLDTDLRGVTGLTREQLEACKAKDAIIDEDTTAIPPVSPVPPSPPSPQSS